MFTREAVLLASRNILYRSWHITARLVTCPIVFGLLQRCADRSSSFHAGTIPASPARSGMHHSGSQAVVSCDSSSSRVALVASR